MTAIFQLLRESDPSPAIPVASRLPKNCETGAGGDGGTRHHPGSEHWTGGTHRECPVERRDNMPVHGLSAVKLSDTSGYISDAAYR